MNGLSPNQLVSHEYKNLHIRFNSTTSSDVDICILLALKDSDNDIYLKEMDDSGIRYKSLCSESNSNKNGTIISLDERDYMDLDSNDYGQLFLLGYDGRIASPAAVLDNVMQLKSLDEIVYVYFQNCSSEPTEFVQWLGLENAKNYRVIGNNKNKGILDIAIMDCQYEVVEYLVRQGLCFNAFISDWSGIVFYSKSQDFFHTFDNLCCLLERGISDFTIRDLHMMMLHFIEGIGSFSRLAVNMIQNPSIDSVRQLICKWLEIVEHDEKKGQLVDTQIFELLGYIGLDFVNPQGVTPLLQAITAQITDVDFYREMLKRGVDLNRKDVFGRCPLVETISPYKKEIFKLFLDNGADADVLNSDNSAVCELATDLNWGLRFFEEDWHIFDSIADKAFLTALGRDGKSPFLLALEAGNLGAIRYLGKGGYIRTDEMPQILNALSRIKSTEIRKEIDELIQIGENKKEEY